MAIFACGSDDNSNSSKATVAAPAAGSSAPSGQLKQLTLGAVVSLNGGAAVFGKSQQQGLQLAVDEINANAAMGVKLTLKVEDDNTDRNQGINVFNKLISDNVNLI